MDKTCITHRPHRAPRRAYQWATVAESGFGHRRNKFSETKQKASSTRWLLAASVVNTTNNYLITSDTTEKQQHTQHSRAPIIYDGSPPPPPSFVGPAMSLPTQKDWKKGTNVRFEVIRAVILKKQIFWGMTPSRVVKNYWRFGTPFMDRLHHEYEGNKLPQKAGNYLRNVMVFFWVVTRRHNPEERRH